MDATQVYIGLGSNLGDRRRNLNRALECIRHIPRTRVDAVSSFYETSPWGESGQGDFYNAAALLESGLGAAALLQALLDIEIKLGRQRGKKWGPREIDLDILLYGTEVIDEEGLHIPHPYLTQRLFVLAPLAEIAPDLVLPGGRKIVDILNELLEESAERVIKIE